MLKYLTFQKHSYIIVALINEIGSKVRVYEVIYNVVMGLQKFSMRNENCLEENMQQHKKNE